FEAVQSVVQIYGTCDSCRTGAPTTAASGFTEALFARDALKIAIATERSGREFYARASRITKNPRARRIFVKLATEEIDHLQRLQTRYRDLLEQHPQLEQAPPFLFFKGAANGLFASGTEELNSA